MAALDALPTAESLAGDAITVDGNHPLAGRTVEARVAVDPVIPIMAECNLGRTMMLRQGLWVQKKPLIIPFRILIR